MKANDELPNDELSSDAADREIADLRAEMSAAGLLPTLPESLEPSQASADAMLARILGNNSSRPPQNDGSGIGAGITERQNDKYLDNRGILAAAIVNPDLWVPDIETVDNVEYDLAADAEDLDEPRARRNKTWQSIFALAASIAVIAAMVLPNFWPVGGFPTTAVVAEPEATEFQIPPRERIAPLTAGLPPSGTRFDSAAQLAMEPGAFVLGDIPAALAAGIGASSDLNAAAAWAPVEGALYVVTWGSSSCPRYAAPQAELASDSVLAPHGENTVLVDIAEPEKWFADNPDDSFVCSDDLSPTTTVVFVPGAVDNGQHLTVELGVPGRLRVEPRQTPGSIGPVALLPR